MSRIKKVQCIVLCLCIAFLSLFAVQGVLSGGDELKSLMLSDESYNLIKSERQSTNALPSFEIIFNEYPLFCDNTNNTYYYSMLEKASNNKNPNVKLKSEQSNLKLAFSQAEINDDFISSAEQISFLVYTDTLYTEFSLSVTTLPIISINLDVEPQNPENPIPSDKEYINADFTVFDNSADATTLNRYINSAGKIKLRGVTSRGYDKKGYRFQLYTESLGNNIRSNFVPLLGLRKDDDWILYPAFNDPEKVRNNLSMKVWMEYGATANDFGMVTGYESEMCEVLINGRYWGLYSLFYPVDEKQLALSENTVTGNTDYWWRGVGYKYAKDYEFVQAKDSDLVVGSYKLKFPSNPTGLYFKKWQAIEPYSTGLSLKDDDEFYKTVTKVVDMDNQIDYWLFIKMTQAVDNNMNNINFVAKYRNGKYTLLMSPWDLDQTWGLCWKNGAFTNTDLIIDWDDPVDHKDFYMVVPRCIEMGMTSVIDKVQERYKQLRQTVLTNQKFEEWLDMYEQMVYGSGAALREKERFERGRSAENMDDLRRRVIDHMDYMDIYINGLDQYISYE